MLGSRMLCFPMKNHDIRCLARHRTPQLPAGIPSKHQDLDFVPRRQDFMPRNDDFMPRREDFRPQSDDFVCRNRMFSYEKP